MMLLNLLRKEIQFGNQVFWVCPLIEESKKIDHSSAVKKFKYLEKIFPKQVYFTSWKNNY